MKNNKKKMSFSELPKQICIYKVLFLDLKSIGSLSQVNKFWKEILDRDQVFSYFDLLLFASRIICNLSSLVYIIF